MAKRLRLALLGEGEDTARWMSEFSSLDCCLQAELSEDTDALVLAPDVRDPLALAKQAIQSRLPVLYATPVHLSSGQVAFLAGLSARQGCLLRFPEPFQHRPGFAFLRRALGGSEPLWQPLYVRSLRLADPSARIDELAMEELAMCTALLGREPDRVSATAAYRDGGEMSAVFCTLQYLGGPIAQCTISLAEGMNARQLVAATAGRTVVLDDLDPVATVRILGGEYLTEGSVIGGAKLVSSASVDPIAVEAKLFVEAVASGDRSRSNAARYAVVAGLWQAARHSIRTGAAQAEPPPLVVIEGGGSSAGTPAFGGRPSLTLVAN